MELRGARILVVDDLDSDARLIKAMLEGSGFTSVTTLTDPFAARDLHVANRYDLVVLDVMMPGMDGFAVLEALEAVNPECPVPVIVVTAEPDHMARALEAGARDFIGKPVRMVELLPRVRNALQLGMLLRERTDDLEEARERYQALVEQSIAGIYIVEDGRFTYANPRLCAWLGYTHDELIGMESIELVAEEDRPRVLEMRARRDAGDLTVLTASYRMLRKDGLIVHLAFDARMMELRGRPVIFGVAQDVTEREHARALLEEAEGHYRALVEQSIVGIYLLERKHAIYANPRLCEMLGYGLDELGRGPLQDLVVEADRPIVEAVQRRRDAGETGFIAYECAMRRKDGSVVHVGVQTRVIDFAGGHGILGVVEDVTAWKRAQNELEAANQRLRTLSERVLGVQEEERRRISRELHDEIGQSLVALGIGLHRLGPHVDASHRNLVLECLNVADAVREKVREISVNLHPPHLDQLGLQDALRWLVSRQAEMTGVRIKCRFSGVEKLRIAPAVEAACYRICQEALTNATRHSHAARIVVELAVRRGELFVKIMDDGVGFDQAAQRQALLTSGSMGLVSMEERARLAGGRLELRTAPAAGTSVCALFPLDARAAESAASRERI
jgi:PAS domain S-box-containing protein